jgi:replicative DNA helicase
MGSDETPPQDPRVLQFIPGGKLPIAAIDAEEALIGTVILNRNALDVASGILRSVDFSDEKHRHIFEACQIAAVETKLDIVCVAEVLRERGRLGQVGGLPKLVDLINGVGVDPYGVPIWAKKVRQKAKLRHLVAECERTKAAAYLDHGDTDDFVAKSAETLRLLSEDAIDPEVELAKALKTSMLRAHRRQTGEEKPVPILWNSIADHFGGGLWGGVHFLNSTTGIGKTTLATQLSMGAALAGVPVAYIGLESEDFESSMRMLGELAGVGWSRAYNGRATPEELLRMGDAIPLAETLPWRPIFGEPQGWPASKLREVGERLRRDYPETNGPGSRPALMVLDYLQIVGAEEEGKKDEIRERVGKAAYICRYLAAKLNIAVLVISSVARDKTKLLSQEAAKFLSFKPDADGRPTERRVLMADELIGTGKESGEIEYSADSVSVLCRVEGFNNSDTETNMVFATVKRRAGPTSWSPMLFTGFKYLEPADGGASFVASQEGKSKEKEAAKVAKEQAKAAERMAREQSKEAEKAAREEQVGAARASAVDRDALAVVRFVLSQNEAPGVRAVRNAAVSNVDRRWRAVRERLEGSMVCSAAKNGQASLVAVNVDLLPDEIKSALKGETDV